MSRTLLNAARRHSMTVLTTLAVASACVGQIDDRSSSRPPSPPPPPIDVCGNSASVNCSPLATAGGASGAGGGLSAGSASGEEGSAGLSLGQSDRDNGSRERERERDPEPDTEPPEGLDGGPPPEAPDFVPPAIDAGVDAAPDLQDAVELFGFNDDAQGWALFASEPPELLGAATLVHDAEAGFAAPGSLLVSAPFSDEQQSLGAEVVIALPLNLSGRSLAVSVRVDDGLFDGGDTPPGARLHVRTGSAGVFADGGVVALSPGEVNRIVMSLDAPVSVDNSAGAHDPRDVRAVGLTVFTGQAGNAAPAQIRIDDVIVF